MTLKEVLGELYTPEIDSVLKDKEFVLKDENMIPKHRLDEVISQKKELEKQIEQHSAELSQLKESAGASEELKAKITELEEQNKATKKEREEAEINLRNDFILTEKLIDAGIHEKEAREIIKAKIKDQVTFKDESVIGFDDVVNPYKDNPLYKHWFGQETIQGQEHIKGESPQTLTKRDQLQQQLQKARDEKNTVLAISLNRQINELQE